MVFRKGLQGLGLWMGRGRMMAKKPRVQSGSKAGPGGVRRRSEDGKHEDMKHEEAARAERALVVGEGKEAVAAPMVVPPVRAGRRVTHARGGTAHPTLG